MLAVIAPYFNPQQNKYRLNNYQLCVDQLCDLGLDVYSVEAAIDGRYHLPAATETWRFPLRSVDFFWHKESLINAAIYRLPAKYDQVVWIDVDLLVYDQSWPERLEHALTIFPVVQAWSHLISLDQYGRRVDDEFVEEFFDKSVANNDQPDQISQEFVETFDPSVELAWSKDPRRKNGLVFLNSDREANCRNYDPAFGCPGLIWGVQRQWLEDVGGLYDRAIVGGGDSIFLFSCAGQWVGRMMQRYSDKLLLDAIRYGERVFRHVAGNIGCVPCLVEHLWHCDYVARQYDSRFDTLRTYDYDPNRHLECDGYGLLNWTNAAPSAMIEGVRDYLSGR